MLYTDTAVGRGDVKMARGYMEDGIMDAFFDAGHIIFNTHADEESSGDTGEAVFGDDKVFRIARAGGARFLLEIVMEFSRDEEEPLPRAVEYRLYRIEQETLLAEGRVYLRNAGDKEELSDEELLQNMGRSLARGALSRL
jgi:hypothetical protein